MVGLKKILLLFIFIICTNVYALDECTTDKMKNLRELANNVEFKYEYELEKNLNEIDDIQYEKIEFDDGTETNDKTNEENYITNSKNNYSNIFSAEYSVKIINMNEKLKIYYRTNAKEEYVLLNNEEFEQYKFGEGQTIEFLIKSYTNDLCTAEILRKYNIKFPIYNNFYANNKDKCNEYKDFEYCTEFIDKKIDYSNVQKLFDEYISKLNKSKDNNNFSINKLSIYVIALFVVIIIIIILVKFKNKNKREVI